MLGGSRRGLRDKGPRRARLSGCRGVLRVGLCGEVE